MIIYLIKWFYKSTNLVINKHKGIIYNEAYDFEQRSMLTYKTIKIQFHQVSADINCICISNMHYRHTIMLLSLVNNKVIKKTFKNCLYVCLQNWPSRFSRWNTPFSTQTALFSFNMNEKMCEYFFKAPAVRIRFTGQFTFNTHNTNTGRVPILLLLDFCLKYLVFSQWQNWSTIYIKYRCLQQ